MMVDTSESSKSNAKKSKVPPKKELTVYSLKTEDKHESAGATAKKLRRSETDRVLAGVAGGLGKYLELDPTLIRILFILMAVFGGSGILIYLVLWLVIPSESDDQKTSEEYMKGNVEEMKQKAYTMGESFRTSTKDTDSKSWGAFVLIGLGVFFLLQNYGWMHGIRFDKLWPLFLVGLGLALLFRR